jgi:hypothetical protein
MANQRSLPLWPPPTPPERASACPHVSASLTHVRIVKHHQIRPSWTALWHLGCAFVERKLRARDACMCMGGCVALGPYCVEAWALPRRAAPRVTLSSNRQTRHRQAPLHPPVAATLERSALCRRGKAANRSVALLRAAAPLCVSRAKGLRAASSLLLSGFPRCNPRAHPSPPLAEARAGTNAPGARQVAPLPECFHANVDCARWSRSAVA